MGTLRLADFELQYLERGAGPPLVFLHGLGSHGGDWEPQLAAFSATHRCLALDLPGSGGSSDLRHPEGPFSVAGFARAVAQGLEALGAAPAHVVGLSMGGMTGLQLALDAPGVVRSLVVVNAAASLTARTPRDRLLLAVRSVLTATAGPKGVARLVAPRLFPRPEQAPLREAFLAQMARNDPRRYAASSRALMGWSVEERVGAVRCPTLLVSADADYTPVAVKEALAARIPGARVAVVADAHHALPIEKPEAFNQVLAAHLATVSGG